MLYTSTQPLNGTLMYLPNLYSKPQSPIHLSWRKKFKQSVPTLSSEIIVSTPPDLMSCQQTPFQRTTLRLTMLLLGFPRGGMVVDRLLEALARDAGRGIVCTTTTIVVFKCFFFTLVSIDREDFFVEVWQSFPRRDATRRWRNCIVQRNHCNQQSSPGHKLMGGSWVGRGGWW